MRLTLEKYLRFARLLASVILCTTFQQFGIIVYVADYFAFITPIKRRHIISTFPTIGEFYKIAIPTAKMSVPKNTHQSVGKL
jgi:hypothetical protein